ncbi:MAG: MBL fold metallo-hydrolase [Burkholderiaceae bacterium]|nr:MBL fold metallo-hydrolase [Burkholderiaceae bacterium]
MPAVPSNYRAILPVIAATIFLLLAFLLAASWLAKAPYASDHVFGNVRTGELWSPKARYVDNWYAVEALDDSSFIIGEPKSSQYNVSYLLAGNARALLIDTGSGERPAGTRSMREVAESLTSKPVMPMLTHFHFDHSGDLNAFDGALLLATPELKARADGGTVQVHATESLSGAHTLRIQRWVASGEAIDLGERTIEARATPGHAHESASFIDRERRYVFTGDFLYQHLGGLVAFLPGSDVTVYAGEIGGLLHTTGNGYRYFGAHGMPEFDANWVHKIHRAMQDVASGAATPRLGTSYLVPGLPLRMHQQDQLLIYQAPLSWRGVGVLAVVVALATALFWRVFRSWGTAGRRA